VPDLGWETASGQRCASEGDDWECTERDYVLSTGLGYQYMVDDDGFVMVSTGYNVLTNGPSADGRFHGYPTMNLSFGTKLW
jgi:hypothetical protein